MTTSSLSTNEKEQLRRYKACVADIKYIIRQYQVPAPDAAWDTIKRLVHDPKLRLKTIVGQNMEDSNG